MTFRYNPVNGIGFDLPPGIYRVSIGEIGLKHFYEKKLKEYMVNPPKNPKEVLDKVDCEVRLKKIEEAFGYIAEELRKPVEELLVKKLNDKSKSIEEVSRKYYNEYLTLNDPKQASVNNLRIAIQKVAYGMAVVDGRIQT